MRYLHRIHEGSTALCTRGEQYKESANYQNDKPTVTLSPPRLLSDGVQFSENWGNHS